MFKGSYRGLFVAVKAAETVGSSGSGAAPRLAADNSAARDLKDLRGGGGVPAILLGLAKKKVVCTRGSLGL